MATPAGRSDPVDPCLRRRGRFFPVGSWVALTIAFLLYSAIHAPVPGAGEPHYFSKSRHFHDSAWCAKDFFLQSANAHLVYFATIGRLAHWFPFPIAAWLGRFLGVALVAAGWVALFHRVGRDDRAPFAVAAIVLGCSALGNVSGEWLFDGIEAKVFAYGFLFLGWALLIDGRWIAAAAAMGSAMAFHPIVGGWGLVAGIAATAARGVGEWARGGEWTERRRDGEAERLVGSVAAESEVPTTIPPTSNPTAEESPPRLLAPSPLRLHAARIALAALVGMLFAAPGVIPALRVVGSSFGADYLQVYYRLRHHLDPTTFSPVAAASYGGLIVVWLVARRFAPRDGAEQWWFWCVTASLAIFAAGLALGWAPPPTERTEWAALRLRLMKFYPFRLADTLVPMAAAVSVFRLASTGERRWRFPGSHVPSIRLFALATATTYLLALARAHQTRWQESILPERRASWHAACDWARESTPGDALFLTPSVTWAFKWYAQRAEYVTFKDCPQDAAGILEWNRRLNLLFDWSQRESAPGVGYSREALGRLHAETGITHVLARKGDLGPFEPAPIYENEHYAVFRIGGTD